VLTLDLIVVALSFLVFRQLNLALYAAIAVFITSEVLDFVLYGSDGAKLIHIISDKPRQIAARLLEELEIGATFIRGREPTAARTRSSSCAWRTARRPRRSRRSSRRKILRRS